MSEIVLAGGCFWGLQAVFLRVNGVLHTQVGYSGGRKKNPSYADVCSDKTGHAESVLIQYNNSIITLPEILDVFFMCHNPTTFNRQGTDFGTQYRSVVFYSTHEEQRVIKRKIKEVSHYFENPIVTEVKKLKRFWPAEDYHQDYFLKNAKQACRQAELCREHFLQKKLSPEQYWVMRGKGTEPPFSGQYIYTEESGVYCCSACHQKLFRSESKFQSGCGWPSFNKSIPGSVIIQKDFSHFMTRDEVLCSRCGSHLGHLFLDDLPATGLRYCINSVALIFQQNNQ